MKKVLLLLILAFLAFLVYAFAQESTGRGMSNLQNALYFSNTLASMGGGGEEFSQLQGKLGGFMSLSSGDPSAMLNFIMQSGCKEGEKKKSSKGESCASVQKLMQFFDMYKMLKRGGGGLGKPGASPLAALQNLASYSSSLPK